MAWFVLRGRRRGGGELHDYKHRVLKVFIMEVFLYHEVILLLEVLI